MTDSTILPVTNPFIFPKILQSNAPVPGTTGQSCHPFTG